MEVATGEYKDEQYRVREDEFIDDGNDDDDDKTLTADDEYDEDENRAVNERGERVLDTSTKRRIIRFNPEWPVCSYVETSKRLCPRRQRTLEDALAKLDGWHLYPEIAIDGTNGTGKSTLVSSMNREYLKINILAPRISCGSDYNHRLLRSFEYLMMQQTTSCENVCWDRFRYSNLVFYYVHLIMYFYRHTEMPLDEKEVYMLLNNFALATNLLQTITLMESEKSIPTIFFVNRNFEHVALSLQRRGSVNDVYNSKEYNYQVAQYHVYKYFAKILGQPLFDLADYIGPDFTLGDLHQAIRAKIDIREKREPIVRLPVIESAETLATLLEPMDDDVLVYSYSSK